MKESVILGGQNILRPLLHIFSCQDAQLPGSTPLFSRTTRRMRRHQNVCVIFIGAGTFLENDTGCAGKMAAR